MRTQFNPQPLTIEGLNQLNDALHQPILELKRERHAEVLFAAITRLISICKDEKHLSGLFAHKASLLCYLDQVLNHLTDDPVLRLNLETGELGFTASGLKALSQQQLNNLDEQLFGDNSFKSVNEQANFQKALNHWRFRYPKNRRYGRLYSAMPEDQPTTPTFSLKEYHSALLNDLNNRYDTQNKKDLSDGNDKIQSLCSNLIILEHLQYLDLALQGQVSQLGDRMELIRLVYGLCFDKFKQSIDNSAFDQKDANNPKPIFDMLLRLTLCQYIHNSGFDLFNNEFKTDLLHFRKALIACCITMQDITAPLANGTRKKRNSLYTKRPYPTFDACKTQIEHAIKDFQERCLPSVALFFFQQYNKDLGFLTAFVEQHWALHQQSGHFPDLFNQYSEAIFPLLATQLEQVMGDTDNEAYQHSVLTLLYNDMIPDLEILHRVTMALDCIDEAITRSNSERETASLNTIKTQLTQSQTDWLGQIAAQYSDRLQIFIARKPDPLGFGNKWYSTQQQEISQNNAEEIHALRNLLLDTSNDQREAICQQLAALYPADERNDRTAKREKCKEIIDEIKASQASPEQIAQGLWHYSQSVDHNRVSELTSVHNIRMLEPTALKEAAVTLNCGVQHRLKKAGQVIDQIDGIRSNSQSLYSQKKLPSITSGAGSIASEVSSNGSTQQLENESSRVEIDLDGLNPPLGPPPPVPSTLTSIFNHVATDDQTNNDAESVTNMTIDAQTKNSTESVTSIKPPPPPPRTAANTVIESNFSSTPGSAETINVSNTSVSDTETRDITNGHKPPPPPPAPSSPTGGKSASQRLFQEKGDHSLRGVTQGTCDRGASFADLLKRKGDEIRADRSASSAPSQESINNKPVQPSSTDKAHQLFAEGFAGIMKNRRDKITGTTNNPLQSLAEDDNYDAESDSSTTCSEPGFN